jgi:uncharacterized membrane protein YoaK (UPF0700 family)
MLSKLRAQIKKQSSPARARASQLIVLVLLFFLGVVSGYTLGNFIYVLLVIAIVLFLVRLINGRSTF